MHHTEILILGGGLVGLTLAIALDKHGISTTIVIDPADPAKTLPDTFDGPRRRLLRRLGGCWRRSGLPSDRDRAASHPADRGA